MKKINYNEKELFGMTLKKIRLAKGMSQEGLAAKSALDRTYISSCERGKRNISLVNISKIARALNVKPSILLKGLDTFDT